MVTGKSPISSEYSRRITSPRQRGRSLKLLRGQEAEGVSRDDRRARSPISVSEATKEDLDGRNRRIGFGYCLRRRKPRSGRPIRQVDSLASSRRQRHQDEGGAGTEPRIPAPDRDRQRVRPEHHRVCLHLRPQQPRVVTLHLRIATIQRAGSARWTVVLSDRMQFPLRRASWRPHGVGARRVAPRGPPGNDVPEIARAS